MVETVARRRSGATPGYQGVGKHDENKDAAVDWWTA